MGVWIGSFILIRNNKYLSNIELYYSPEKISDHKINIIGDDVRHITKVMRHNVDDKLYVTDGKGKIISGLISEINKNIVSVAIDEVFSYSNNFENLTFCVPKLKSAERFEFALEKCTELGITNFIIFDSDRAVSKGNKIERWNKILIAAMKQSLRSFLPKLKIVSSVEEIAAIEGEKFLFEQNAKKSFGEVTIDKNRKYYLIFGPEGGLSGKEFSFFNENSYYNLTGSRLRSETAIVKCAVLVTN